MATTSSSTTIATTGTEWTVSYGLCDPNVDITARGCDCKGNGCIECAPERDPDEKFEQQNDK
jgi:hypothetical protein